MTNPLLRVDSYKHSHPPQLPPGTTEMSAYIEARKGGRFEEVTFIGAQGFCMDKLSQRFTYGDIIEAKEVLSEHGEPFDDAAWFKMLDKYYGYLPLSIQAIPEGMTVPCGTPLVQLRATDSEFSWLTGWIETPLLRSIWYPSTVATLSRHAKKLIYAGLLRSSDDPKGQLPFKLHDFGARGTSSGESAEIGGCAHLVNFAGSDTLEGLMYARRVYGATMPAFSIPAAEHSTVTSWGRNGEKDFMLNLIDKFGKPGKLFAAPIDSYDDENFIRYVIGSEEVKTRLINSGSTFVARPDSGHPVDNPVNKLDVMGETFGYRTNKKNYRVLPDYVRMLQGDGMTLVNIRNLVEHVTIRGWSMDNIAMGMGGGLLQDVGRDDLRFAQKANEIVIDGVARDIQKNPATDPTKASKAGRQAVFLNEDRSLTVMREQDETLGRELSGAVPLLNEIWRNGSLRKRWTFDEVRANAEIDM